MEKAVQGAQEPEGHQQEEEMLHDELEGGEVEDEKDDDAGGDSVDDVGYRVLEGQAETPFPLSNRCYEALMEKNLN